MSNSTHLLLALVAGSTTAFGASSQPWQKLSDPTVAEVAGHFASPPIETGAQFTWGWQGPVDREVIARDLDGMKSLGVNAAALEPKTGMLHPYLSPEYFDLVKIAVEEAKKRDMRLWIMDEGDYPSGLAGGKFTVERPDLRMQALAAPERVAVAGGTTLTRDLSPDVVCAVATDKTGGTTQVLDLASRKLAWTAPTTGDWEVVLTSRVFRTMPTRSANNPRNAKDTTHSLMDFLDPAATQLFKEWTFEGYRKAIGGEFGKTVLGFRGDEPGYGFNPWTPKLFDEFSRRKGYDLRPYLAAFAAGTRNAALSPEQRRVYADYCDVWSDLFRDNYCSMEGDWCAANGLEMQLHVEHEEILPQLATSDGDFFKCFRNIQEPGIDIIWHQIWMDNPADFPKLASSAAHLYGRPRAMCESFAAYQPQPDLKQARWLLDFLMTRGINRIEYMFWSASVPNTGNRASNAAAAAAATMAPSGPAAATKPAGTPPAPGEPSSGYRYFRDPGFPAVAGYVNRLSYLLGAGRPAANIGLYIPSSSFWLADSATGTRLNKNLLDLAHQLIEHQRDFDFVDEQALSSVLKLKGGELVNLSNQGYRAIIVPPSLVISKTALAQLRAFASAGGTVIFIGEAPALVSDKNFLHATGPADISWATMTETTIAVTPAVLDRLPKPDVALDQASPLISYTHRRLRDADVYFIFNSGDAKASLHASLAGTGTAQTWDANTGKISLLPGAAPSAGAVRIPLDLEPWTTTVVVVGNAPTVALASK
jgi:hypothetical protein